MAPGDRIGRIDKQYMGEQRKESIEKNSEQISKRLIKLKVGYTYTPDTLETTFNIRMAEGLMSYLAPFAEFEKDGENFRLVGFTSRADVETQTEAAAGYNQYVSEVYQTLYNKYGHEKSFPLGMNDIPEGIRKNIPPSLMPKIFEALIDRGYLLRIPGTKHMVTFQGAEKLLDENS